MSSIVTYTSSSISCSTKMMEDAQGHDLVDLSHREQVRKLLCGVPDLHMKQYLFKEIKSASGTAIGAKSDYEAIKWREQAERELLQVAAVATAANGPTNVTTEDDAVYGSGSQLLDRERTLYRALVCFNLAIAYAEQGPEKSSDTPPQDPSLENGPECELALSYFGRGQVYLQLCQSEAALQDIRRAIACSRSNSHCLRMSFALLDYYLIKDRLPLYCNEAIDLVTSIQQNFGDGLSEDQSAALASFATLLEHQRDLKSLNTLNYARKSLLQSLKCTKLTSMVAKDQPLVEQLVNYNLDNELYPPTMTLDGAVLYADGNLTVTNEIGQSRLLLLEQALAHVTKPGMELSYCAKCLMPLQFFPTVPCHCCSTVLYCSEQCEFAFWSDCHQYECGSEENRSIWSQMDLTSKLTIRFLLLAFGSAWPYLADYTRELVCGNEGGGGVDDRFGPKKADLNVLPNNPIAMYRSLCELFLSDSGKLTKMSLRDFTEHLAQSYGVFAILDQCSDQQCEPRLCLQYRGQLVHGLMLCRLVVECALRGDIAQSMQGDGAALIGQRQLLRTYTIRALVRQLVMDNNENYNKLQREDKQQQDEQKEQSATDGNNTSDSDGGGGAIADSAASLFQCLLKQHEVSEQQQQEGQSCQLPDGGSIGIALYPGNVCLKRQQTSPSKENQKARNCGQVYSGTYRAIRSLRPLAKGELIQVDSTGPLALDQYTGNGNGKQLDPSDDKVIGQMVYRYLDSMVKLESPTAEQPLNAQKGAKEMDDPKLAAELSLLQALQQEMAQTIKQKPTTMVPIALQLSLLTDLSLLYERMGNIKQAVNCVGQCLQLTKSMPSMVSTQLAYLLRLCKLQFERFTERDCPQVESMSVANHCLMNCSQLIYAIEARCLPMQVYLALVKPTEDKSTEQQSADKLTEELIVHQQIGTLTELEEMLVSANIFAQQLERGLATPSAAS